MPSLRRPSSPGRAASASPEVAAEIRVRRYICANKHCLATSRVFPAFLAPRMWRAWASVERVALPAAPVPPVATTPTSPATPPASTNPQADRAAMARAPHVEGQATRRAPRGQRRHRAPRQSPSAPDSIRRPSTWSTRACKSRSRLGAAGSRTSLGSSTSHRGRVSWRPSSAARPWDGAVPGQSHRLWRPPARRCSPGRQHARRYTSSSWAVARAQRAPGRQRPSLASSPVPPQRSLGGSHSRLTHERERNGDPTAFRLIPPRSDTTAWTTIWRHTLAASSTSLQAARPRLVASTAPASALSVKAASHRRGAGRAIPRSDCGTKPRQQCEPVQVGSPDRACLGQTQRSQAQLPAQRTFLSLAKAEDGLPVAPPR